MNGGGSDGNEKTNEVEEVVGLATPVGVVQRGTAATDGGSARHDFPQERFQSQQLKHQERLKKQMQQEQEDRSQLEREDKFHLEREIEHTKGKMGKVTSKFNKYSLREKSELLLSEHRKPPTKFCGSVASIWIVALVCSNLVLLLRGSSTHSQLLQNYDQNHEDEELLGQLPSEILKKRADASKQEQEIFLLQQPQEAQVQGGGEEFSALSDDEWSPDFPTKKRKKWRKKLGGGQNGMREDGEQGMGGGTMGIGGGTMGLEGGNMGIGGGNMGIGGGNMAMGGGNMGFGAVGVGMGMGGGNMAMGSGGMGAGGGIGAGGSTGAGDAGGGMPGYGGLSSGATGAEQGSMTAGGGMDDRGGLNDDPSGGRMSRFSRLNPFLKGAAAQEPIAAGGGGGMPGYGAPPNAGGTIQGSIGAGGGGGGMSGDRDLPNAGGTGLGSITAGGGMPGYGLPNAGGTAQGSMLAGGGGFNANPGVGAQDSTAPGGTMSRLNPIATGDAPQNPKAAVGGGMPGNAGALVPQQFGGALGPGQRRAVTTSSTTSNQNTIPDYGTTTTTTTGTVQALRPKPIGEHGGKGGMSACLITMDDNHWLPEWLAFHYHVLPLKYVMTLQDPRSRTSPQELFDRWKGRLEIEVVTDQQVGLAGNTDPLIRKRHFHKYCLETLLTRREAAKTDDEHDWVVMVDTDEFIRPNIYISHTKPIESSIGTTGCVVKTIQHYETTEKTRDGRGCCTTKQPTRNCLNVPRLQMTNQDPEHKPMIYWDVKKDRDDVVNTDNYLTLRFFHHNGLADHEGPGGHRDEGGGKYIVNLARIKQTDIVFENDRPAFCPKQVDHFPANPKDTPIPDTAEEKLRRESTVLSPLMISHYMGTFEQHAFRNDPRDWNSAGRLPATAADRNTESWLEPFIRHNGGAVAKELLQNTGVVEGRQQRGYPPPPQQFQRQTQQFHQQPQQQFQPQQQQQFQPQQQQQFQPQQQQQFQPQQQQQFQPQQQQQFQPQQQQQFQPWQQQFQRQH